MATDEEERRIFEAVWGKQEPFEPLLQSFCDTLVKWAMQVCHETGDMDSWVKFCADTIRFMLVFYPAPTHGSQSMAQMADEIRAVFARYGMHPASPQFASFIAVLEKETGEARSAGQAIDAVMASAAAPPGRPPSGSKPS